MFLLLFVAGSVGCSQEGGWHIAVERYQRPAEDQLAESVAQILKESTGVDPQKVILIRENGSTVLSYGRYSDFESPPVQGDLKLIKSLAMPGKGVAFPFAHIELLPEEDPSVPQEWMLTNASGYWTLEVARFDSPGRKKAALAYLKMLRSKKVSAYVWNGRYRSVVTVGSFPQSAMTTVGKPPVVPAELVITDPQLKRFQKDFKFLLINGEYHYLVGPKGQRLRLKTEVIKTADPDGSIW
jgi:hypothetical protein